MKKNTPALNLLKNVLQLVAIAGVVTSASACRSAPWSCGPKKIRMKSAGFVSIPNPPRGPLCINDMLTIGFETNMSFLSKEARMELSKLARCLLRANDQFVDIHGHADYRGASSYNMTLSEKRAHSVMDYLVSKNVSGDKVTVTAHGEKDPVAEGKDPESLARNREAVVISVHH